MGTSMVPDLFSVWGSLDLDYFHTLIPHPVEFYQLPVYFICTIGMNFRNQKVVFFNMAFEPPGPKMASFKCKREVIADFKKLGWRLLK